jgi:hypothetical protein
MSEILIPCHSTHSKLCWISEACLANSCIGITKIDPPFLRSVAFYSTFHSIPSRGTRF